MLIERIGAFAAHLWENEKSKATVEKYARDASAFAEFIGNRTIDRELVIGYKQYMIEKGYAARSVNSMIASVNAFLEFLGRPECRVKALKIQRQAFCPEEKELTRAEYQRLVDAAKRKGNERLALLIQTICGTGIRVSELRFIRVSCERAAKKTAPLVRGAENQIGVYFYHEKREAHEPDERMAGDEEPLPSGAGRGIESVSP